MAIIVENAVSHTKAEAIALRPGVALLTCQGHVLLHPATLLALMENTFKGEESASVTVRGEWEGRPQAFVLEPGRVRIEARPELSASVQRLYERGRKAIQAAQFADAERVWEQAAQQTEDKSASVWLYGKAGEASEKNSDWQSARAFYLQAYALLPEGKETAVRSFLCTALGRCGQYQNELKTAAQWYAQAQALDEQEDRPLWSARNLNHLGRIAYFSRDIVRAHDCFTRALALCTRHVPDSLDMAESLNKLAVVRATRGDLTTAWDYFFRALGIYQQQAPNTLDSANVLNNLGGIAYHRRELTAALDYFTRAYVIRKRFDPRSLPVAASLNNIGNVLLDRHDATRAKKYYLRSLAIREEDAPESIEVAVILYNLGLLAADQGDLMLAQAYQTRVLAICERCAPPDSLDYGDTLEALGQVAQRQGHLDEAIERFRAAVEILERQRTLIPATEDRALLLDQHTRKYASLIQCYLARHDVASAFFTLERARARSLLELLADRSLDFAADAPSDLLQQIRTLDAQRAAAYAQWYVLPVGTESDPQRATLRGTIRELERQREELRTQIRTVSPRYAALQDPQPLSLTAAQAQLDPGTLLLSFFVDDDQTYLFAITRTEKHAFTLPVGRAALEDKTGTFLTAITDCPKLLYDRENTAARGRELYSLLFAVVTPLLRKAERLLLCPDGPLHTLPFSALVMNNAKKPCYLGTAKPLHTILSATLYAQIQREARSGPIRRLLAFGDPLYSSWLPLPHTRREVAHLAELFGNLAEVRLRAEATKTAVLEESADADILHFACHGRFDPKLPLSSALILTETEASEKHARPGDKGLLQAWEILEMHLQANLVVLSACWTGLGREEVRGEGLIGLTRAFQYAGAKSLVVSLWAVGDESSACFMKSFYESLQKGRSKDEALRQAIQTLQSNPLWRDPWYWSAYVLIGDRKEILRGN